MSMKSPLPDEDQNLDWETEGGATIPDRTAVRVGEPVTAPHDVAPLATGLEMELAKARDAGYRKGFIDGQVDAVSAFALTFVEGGLDDAETKNVLQTAAGRLTRI